MKTKILFILAFLIIAIGMFIILYKTDYNDKNDFYKNVNPKNVSALNSFRTSNPTKKVQIDVWNGNIFH